MILFKPLLTFCGRRSFPQVKFRLSINDSSPLPPGQDTPLLAEFELTGVDAVKAKHNDTDKISIHFRSAPPTLTPALQPLFRPDLLFCWQHTSLIDAADALEHNRLDTCSP